MDIFNKILEEKIDEILNMSKEIDFGNLVYKFKGSTPSKKFTIYGGPMYTYHQLKNGEKNTATSTGRAKRFLEKFK